MVNNTAEKKASIYRMVSDKHICPYGLKSKSLLERQGFTVKDHHLTNREDTDAFKAKYDVKTTPQTFIGEERIGGYDALVDHFGLPKLKQEGVTYQPIIAIFGTALLLAVATLIKTQSSPFSSDAILLLIAFSMCLLALMKIRDLYSFTNQFLNYDLLAQRYVPYAYAYPFIEGLAGLLMIAGVLSYVAAPLSLVIGTVGAFSVIKAVYFDKRELKCACVGGNSSVPLGAISLTENLIMMAAGAFMLFAG